MMKLEFILINSLVFLVFVFVTTCATENVKKSIDDNRDDTGESYETKDESLDIPMESEPNNITCTRRQGNQMHEIRKAQYKQFPFVVAILSQQNDFLCSGSVVSNGLVLTTALCTQLPVSYVLMNTTSDKKDDTTVLLHVIKVEKFPTFTGATSGLESDKDIGLIYTEKHNNSIASKIKLSNFTNPRHITDVEGIGFGINADIGQARDLQYIGMEVRYVSDVSEVVRAYFDCVETKVITCFKDTGGPVVFDNELIGIITKGQQDCTKEMSATYAVNKRMVDFVPTYVFKTWLDEKIKKNEEQEPVALATFPAHPPIFRANVNVTTPNKKNKKKRSAAHPSCFAVGKIVVSLVLCVLVLC